MYEEKRKIVEDYIRTNPNCTYADIRRGTKIHVERFYKNMTGAYRAAGVSLSKNLTRRNNEKQKQDVADFIRSKPGCTVTEIYNNTGVCIPRVFGTVLNAYKLAGVPYVKKPVTSGVRNPFVIKRCRDYEKRVVRVLAELGEVKYHARTNAGITDCLFMYNNKNFVVEIKDFRARNNMTMSQIKQLASYMEALNCKQGLLICPRESFPKRKNGKDIQIDNKNIKILSLEDIKEMIKLDRISGSGGI